MTAIFEMVLDSLLGRVTSIQMPFPALVSHSVLVFPSRALLQALCWLYCSLAVHVAPVRDSSFSGKVRVCLLT